MSDPAATQILFNSPALHALKRSQLVSLCKQHDLKANGKNSELIYRLEQKASRLPPDMAHIQNDGDDDDESDDVGGVLPGAFVDSQPARPSEQWEMVMDDIQEVDEPVGSLSSVNSTLRTKGTSGEFGTNNTKSSVASSLKKALASSLGIKRANAARSTPTPLASSAIPTARDNERELPEPSLPAPEPIPGNPGRAGVPAPSNARLSVGSGDGITTTVRLIKTSYGEPMPSPPRLAPHPTTFDLDMGTPGKKLVWPASPATTGRLYPAIPFEDLKPTPASKMTFAQAMPTSLTNSPTPIKTRGKEKADTTEEKASEDKKVVKEKGPFAGTPARVAALKKPVDVPDMFSPAKPPVNNSGSLKKPTGRISAAQDKPFLFGSPLPQHRMSNKDFDAAAASVLEEMNKRLADAGVKPVEKKILDSKPSDVFGVIAKPTHKTDNGDRFAKMHEEAFNKMDSIATHYAARRVLAAEQAESKKRKSDALVAHAGATPAAKKRSISIHADARARVVSTASRRRAIPGGYGGEHNDDSDDAEKEESADRRAGKRIRVGDTSDVHSGKRISVLSTTSVQTAEEREREERRRERGREAVKRKLEESRQRRSSRGRASIVNAPPPKASRLGFLASAKSLVRNVWNMGAGAGAKSAPSSVPKPPSRLGSKAATVTGSSKDHVKIPADPSLHKATTSSTTRAHRRPPGTQSRAPTRPPIPSFDDKPTADSIGVAAHSHSTHATQSEAAHSHPTTKPKSTAEPSAPGTKKTAAPVTTADTSSLAAKKRAPQSRVASGSSDTVAFRRNVASRLLAPTASSLAKRHAIVVPNDRETTPVISLDEHRPFASPITNHVASPRGTNPTSPIPTQIFSRPLDGFGSSPVSPEKTKGKQAQSLDAAASTLMARSSENTHPTAPGMHAQNPGLASARKPRISRSRVIAKVSAQRNGPATPGASAIAGPSGHGRTRSSIGAAPRRSLVVKQNRMSGADVLMSAKKKARQTEFARRKSRIAVKVAPKAERRASGDVEMGIDG